MDNWTAMFGEVRRIVRQSSPLDESLMQVIKFADNSPELCDEAEYWQQITSHEFRPAFDVMVSWVKAGMAQLQPKEGWEFLLLDLGDCLETFRLYCPGSQEVMAEPKLRTLLSPFSDVKYCKQVLRGRDKLYLLSGFESLFTLLATVTTAGLVYEDV